MTGFFVYVARQRSGDRGRPATFETADGDRVAEWTSDWCVRRALLALLPPDAVTFLGGIGYPGRMTARAGALLPALRRGGAPCPYNYDKRVTFYEDVVAGCAEDEWLIIVMWDRN